MLINQTLQLNWIEYNKKRFIFVLASQFDQEQMYNLFDKKFIRKKLVLILYKNINSACKQPLPLPAIGLCQTKAILLLKDLPSIYADSLCRVEKNLNCNLLSVICIKILDMA